jgi:hypothetical protein
MYWLEAGSWKFCRAYLYAYNEYRELLLSHHGLLFLCHSGQVLIYLHEGIVRSYQPNKVFDERGEPLTWLTEWAVALIVNLHCHLHALDRLYRIHD